MVNWDWVLPMMIVMAPVVLGCLCATCVDYGIRGKWWWQ